MQRELRGRALYIQIIYCMFSTYIYAVYISNTYTNILLQGVSVYIARKMSLIYIRGIRENEIKKMGART